MKDILYFESGNHRVTLHTEGEKWQYKAGIGKVEEELKQYGFARCHAGFLVNCSHISVIKKGSLKLQTGQVIPVSRNRQKETERKFLEYIRSVRL